MKRIISLVMLAGITLALAAAYNPPTGGESAHALLSPSLAGGNSSVAGGAFEPALPAELAVNPALAAAEQRIVLDLSYLSLFSNGTESGLGHVLNLGMLYPTRWAVFGGSLNFLTSPFDSLPLGTAGSLRLTASKDVSDKLYVGAGISAAAGSGWGIVGDLGMLYRYGNLGFMSDARFGFSLTGIGRPFTPDTEGVNGGSATGYLSMITPRTAIAATLVDTKAVKLGASAGLAFPTFQNLVFDTGMDILIKDTVTVSTGWSMNLVEAINETNTWLPSLALGVKLNLDSAKSDSFLARNSWDKSEMTPTVAIKPFHNDIYAAGAGVNIKLGVIDRKPPAIAVDYPEPVYFSPNNDGVQDELAFPVSITDDRYILAWDFTISRADGTVVRTIANKEARPEMEGIASFWKLVTRAKQGIALPDTLRWDGFTDSGELAPDGEYRFVITSRDDNDNVATTGTHVVFLDNTPPSITISPPSGANAMIFSPDGDGNKDTFTIAQNGSVEDLWKAEVLNNAGAAVKTVDTLNAAPAAFVWDGKTDSGSLASDGVYSYRISATDRAGNSARAAVNNIIVDTDKPSINISIDTNFFSPNGDGIKDVVSLQPSIPVTTGLIEWNITIQSRSGEVRRVFTGASKPPVIAFDGKNDSGSILAEGDYQARITARYINGHAPEARSPFFTLDTTAPEAQTRASIALFSPVGDGKLDTVTFAQQTSMENSWTGEVFALGQDGTPAGKAIRTYRLGAKPETSVVWDGRDDSGKLAGDGVYGYRLTSTDMAGNTGFSNIARVELNTEKADLILQANLAAFSPNGDGIKDTIVFTPILKATTPVSLWLLTISDRANKAVRTIRGTGKVPASISWNGTADPAGEAATGERSPDGLYTASLEVTLINQQTSRSQAPEFLLDTVYPTIEVSTPWTVFSPNADGNRDNLQFTQNSSAEELWTGIIANQAGKAVRTLKWNGRAESFTWHATDDSGNPVPDGNYTYTVQTEDRAGNTTTGSITGIRVDARIPKAFITAELPAFSPNADTVKDSQRLSIVTSIPEGLESWSVRIVPEGTKTPVRSWESGSAGNLPAVINWDGKTNSGQTAQGMYTAELSLNYTKGDRITAVTPAFLANAVPPALNVRLMPRWFSPDNDGIDDELFINLSAQSLSGFADWSFEIREPEGSAGNVFWRTGGKGTITERIIWDGRSLRGELVQAATDYPFTFTVKDDVGMTSVIRGYIPVDVLVIRDGDRLKIAVPSIIFRENAADFNGLATEVVEKNTQVLRRIAEILNKFRDYKVQVEGHANNVTGTQREEEAELIPLSQQRAEAVRTFLVRNGVDASRLSTIGLGGTKPVAQRSDRENWWKNRRVEFILIK